MNYWLIANLHQIRTRKFEAIQQLRVRGKRQLLRFWHLFYRLFWESPHQSFVKNRMIRSGIFTTQAHNWRYFDDDLIITFHLLHIHVFTLGAQFLEVTYPTLPKSWTPPRGFESASFPVASTVLADKIGVALSSLRPIVCTSTRPPDCPFFCPLV